LAVPFLRPGDVPRVETDGDSYLAGVHALYQAALQKVLLKRQAGEAILAMGHCHLDGGAVSQDSERRIVIGGLEALSVAMFEKPIAYAALGHLHFPQSVGGKDWVRYSGSPLPMSFSEIDYPHQIVCVELAGEQLKSIQTHLVPRAVDLLRIPAKPAPLSEALVALEALSLANQVLPEERWPYLEVRLLLDAPEPSARTEIESVLNGKPVRLAGIDVRYQRGDDKALDTEDPALGDLSQLQPEDLLQRHYQKLYGATVPDDLLQAFQTLLLETEASA
jgi:exonuclease SbcD